MWPARGPCRVHVVQAKRDVCYLHLVIDNGQDAGMSENPWWRPGDEDDVDWDEPLPEAMVLMPDYGAELPLWGLGFGNIDWHFTRFSRELLDRLAAWQQGFDDNFHWESGWRSASARDRWAGEADDPATAVRAELGTRSKLVVDLWPLG